MKLASLVAVVVLVLVAAALLLHHSIVATGPIGIGVQVAAVLLMLWARVTFGGRSFHATAGPTEGGLVTTGPYRFLRHPIYAAILWFLLVGIAAHPSLVSVSLGVVAVIAVAVRMLTEERLLVERYPEYAVYATRTKRVIPFVL